MFIGSGKAEVGKTEDFRNKNGDDLCMRFDLCIVHETMRRD